MGANAPGSLTQRLCPYVGHSRVRARRNVHTQPCVALGNAMAEKRDWTMVSDLVGEIQFNVSGGKEGSPDYVPKTEGFVVRVTYESSSARMKAALNSTRIAVQNTMRTYYRNNKRFPFAPGKVQAVDGEGRFTLPVSSQVDRIEAQLKAGQVDRTEQIRLARMLGLEVPQAWLDETAKLIVDGSADEDNDDSAKYPEGSLDKVGIAKLKVLAQNEELEGYDEMTADELREELYLIEK